MTIPEHLRPAVARAVEALQRQCQLDGDLLVSEPDADGRVQIEGTVDLAALVAAVRSGAPDGKGGEL
jgi:hypothetical protein